IRYGQYYVEKNGSGILAYICPHGYLDNPTFRGMRYSLLQAYDSLYILDLHGNSKKKETAPDGSKDDNVFDIQQGVCISLFVKTGKKKAGTPARVQHAQLYGRRPAKYEALSTHTLQDVAWQPLQPQAPNYFFVPKDFEILQQYEQGFSVPELFPVNSVGIVTARDAFSIRSSREEIQQVVADFVQLEVEQARSKYELGPDVRDWRVEWAQQDARQQAGRPERYVPIAYRPFDTRYTLYTGKTKGFLCMPREKVMRHFLQGENVGLVVGRQGQVVGSMPWNLAFMVDAVADLNLYYRGGGQVFPLYLYPAATELGAGGPATPGGAPGGAPGGRQPNLAPALVARIAQGLGLRYTPEKEATPGTFAPLDLLDYIYAVLHS
ncbi:MAG: type ISP restriction/modification enzyme, partial [Sphingobacteriia bacterium]